jgi:hypothetical protein
LRSWGLTPVLTVTARFILQGRRDPTVADAARFFSALRQDGGTSLSPASVNKLKHTLKATFSLAVSPVGYIRENPFKAIKQDKVTDQPIRYVCPAEF